eukprot:jgi/Psemu1/17149/gm1.17149_g
MVDQFDWNAIDGIKFRFKGNSPYDEQLNAVYSQIMDDTGMEDLFVESSTTDIKVLTPSMMTNLRGSVANAITSYLPSSTDIQKGHITQLLSGCTISYITYNSDTKKVHGPIDLEKAAKEAISHHSASEDLDISKASALINFSLALTLPGEDGPSGCNSGGGGMAGGHLGTIMYGGRWIPGLNTQKLRCLMRVMRCGKTLNHEVQLGSTYIFIETKPGVLSAMVCLPIEAVTDEETPLLRTTLRAFKDATGGKTLLPSDVQDVLEASKCLSCPISLLLEPSAKPAKLGLIKTKVEERYPNLQLPTAKALAPINPTNVKVDFTALARQLKVEEKYLSSVDLQLAVIKLIISQQNGNHSDTLMNANARLTEDFGKLKSQPPALAKAKQDKVTQLFNYFAPDLLELPSRIHVGNMASLRGILEFSKACSTQTPGDMLLDRISRLESTSAPMQKGENSKENAAKTTNTVPLKTVRGGNSVDKVSTLSCGTRHSMETETMKLLKTCKDTIEGQVRAYVKKKWYDTIIKHWLEKIGLVSDGVIVESSGNYGTFDILQYVPTADIQLTQPYYDIILPFDDITAVDSEMAKVPSSFPGTVALNTDSMEILAKEYRQYGNAANEEFYYFVTRILSAINPGKTNFRLRKTKDLISTIFTVTDEAFALMIIDNDGSANGWDKQGRKVFAKLCKKIQTLRENPETGINLEKMMLQRFYSESNPTSTVSINGSTVASSLAEEESEDENYIDPAWRQLLDEMEEV